jgi:hypothetical protein
VAENKKPTTSKGSFRFPRALIGSDEHPRRARRTADADAFLPDVVPSVLSRPIAQFPGTWKEIDSEEHGQKYYHNTETQESTWDKPEDLAWVRVKHDASEL